MNAKLVQRLLLSASPVLGMTVAIVAQSSSAASIIWGAKASPIAARENVVIDSSPSTNSDFGWDLTYRDHAAFPGGSPYGYHPRKR